MSHPDFDVSEHDEGGRVRLSIRGELDLLNAASLEDRLDRLAAEKRGVCIDLSELEFIDSTGIRVLVRAFLNARDEGRQLDVSPELTQPVARVLRLVNIEGLIPREA